MERWRFLWLAVLLVGVGFLQRGLAEERYTVKSGDTLSGISKSYGVSVEQLKKANRLGKDILRPAKYQMSHTWEDIPIGRFPIDSVEVEVISDVLSVKPVPSLTPYGMAVLAVLLLISALYIYFRSRKVGKARA